ncbi:MAG: bifunctional UDP-N-acetylglucosamine diphosphorylase/glucosamine-1-phosphate N-acetyltransferase GlmU [Candidatus Dormibacteria bacterium]
MEGVETIEGRRGDELTAVILAAGQGKRMRSALPKVLHRVAGQPMLAYPVALARALGASRIVVVHAPGQAESLRELCAGCEMVVQPEPRGTGDAVRQVPAAHRGNGDVLVLYGDTPLLTVASARSLLKARRVGAHGAALLAARLEDPRGYGRVVQDERGARVVEEADATAEERALTLVNTGFCCFLAEALWPVLDGLEPSSSTGEYYLTEVFGRMERRAVVECGAEEALGVNDRVQLAAAEAVVRRRVNRALALAGVTITDPANTHIDAGVQVGADTIIEPYSFLRGQTVVGGGCHIGPFAEISDCRIGDRVRVGRSQLESSNIEEGVSIGPFNHLRPGSVVARHSRIGNFAEIKNSLVGPDSDVHHFSYLGDAVLGRRVNIGAGTVTANYDGIAKHRTLIGDEVFIGTDSTLVAPVSIGDRAYTAAGSVITRDVDADALAIERTEQRAVPGFSARRRKRSKDAPAG